ncbi:MAG: adenylate/guanylate cyclase domain-containing protein [Povalibacter sp.]
MRWWAHSRLRTKIFLAFSALLLVVLILTLGLTQYVVSRDAQQTLNRELQTTRQVFENLLKERAARLKSNSTLLASDFALKSIIATHFDPKTYDAPTLASAALSYQERMGVDLLLITDEAGVVLASQPGSRSAGRSLAGFEPLTRAIETQEAASTITAMDGSLFQLVAVPVFAPDVIGFLVLGQAIDDGLAMRLKQATGAEISFVTQNKLFASSWSADSRERFVPDPNVRASMLSVRSEQGASLLALANERFLVLIVPIEARLWQPLYALVQGSYDQALAPLRGLQRRIILIGTAGMIASVLVGIALAGGITAPLQSLIAGTREVLRGNLQHRTSVRRNDEIGFLTRSFNEMVEGLQERERIRDTFGRFVSNDVAEAVLGGQVPLEGGRRDVTILFQDIRGFTSLSENLDPAKLLALLNRFFTEVVAAVEAEGGVVKQFLGDGVMALFGAPQSYPDHAARAVRAALAISKRVDRLNVELSGQDISPLRIGVGIHTGSVVAGLIGPDNRVEYGVVGDAVNLASRIEALTRELDSTILVSREVASQLDPSFALGKTAVLPVRGRRQCVDVVEVLGGA